MTREIRLASRPRGWPTAENFALVQVDTPPLADGQVRVRNLYLSVDPYMRGRMNDVKSYTPPFQIGQPLEGGAVGEVVESRAAGLKPGDVVTSMSGWRDAFVADARDVRLVSRSVEPLSAYLGVLGVTGLTAWVGLNLVDVKAGDRVFVSAAAGAVGSVAGQLARLRGCRARPGSRHACGRRARTPARSRPRPPSGRAGARPRTRRRVRRSARRERRTSPYRLRRPASAPRAPRSRLYYA